MIRLLLFGFFQYDVYMKAQISLPHFELYTINVLFICLHVVLWSTRDGPFENINDERLQQ